MGKFCQNCGNELSENQDICLGCGILLKKEKQKETINNKGSHSGYKTTTGVIMIVLGACMILGANNDMYDFPVIVFSIPGLLGVVAGILNLNSKKNPSLLIISATLLFLGAITNFIGIIDVSIYMILAIVFGIFNIIYSKDN